MVTDSRSPSRSRSRSPRRSRKKKSRRDDSGSSRSPSKDRSRSKSRDRSDGNPNKNRDGTYKKNSAVSKVIGVFGMSLRTDERELEYQFKKYGKVEKCVIVWNHRDNRSRGYGFVYMEEEDDAADAVDALNGKDIDGREVRVDFSYSKQGNPPKPRRSRSPDRRRRRSRSPPRRRRSRDRSRDRDSRRDSRRDRSRSRDRRR